MAAALQASFQASLFDGGPSVGIGPLGSRADRLALADGAWIDVRPRWITGADLLFERLRDGVAWQAERRLMYGRVVDVPRLVRFHGGGEALPDPILAEARRALSEHYAAELGEPFETVGLCLYRDGRDSVSWHGDRTGRGARHDTMVAIVVLGPPRPLLLRQRGGGTPAVRHDLGHGDLLVMGGSCQRTWDHAVPKTTGHLGPRISIQFRPHYVR